MITIWHNPRCSKSRQTLALIEASERPFTVRRYLEDTPNEREIAAAQKALGLPGLIDMMRRGEAVFRDLGLSASSPQADLMAALLAHPILIERPIVFAGTRAVIGRPPEAVAELL